MNKHADKCRQSSWLPLTIAIIMTFCTSNSAFSRAGTIAPGKVKPEPTESAPGNATNVAGDILGKWWYTAILYSDGKTSELRNRQSNLELKADGKYSQNIWAGDALQGHEGTYTVRGNRLTLDWEGEKEVYTMTFGAGGSTLTLKADDGSGWKLERAKK